MALADTNQDAAIAVAYKDMEQQVLRIAASDVAAVAGYNEWADIRELFLERLLYQDLDHVLRLDAENLGLKVENRHQRAERLLAKAADDELRMVRVRAGDGSAVATVQDAQVLRDKAQSLLKKAENSQKLSQAEAIALSEDLRYDINTKFGTRNEDVALKVYERRTGTEVLFNNDRKLVWPFPGSRTGEGVPDGALKAPLHLSQGWTKRGSSSFKRPRQEGNNLSTNKLPSPEDSVFLKAITDCLKQVPIRATVHRLIGQVVSKSLVRVKRCPGEVCRQDEPECSAMNDVINGGASYRGSCHDSADMPQNVGRESSSDDPAVEGSPPMKLNGTHNSNAKAPATVGVLMPTKRDPISECQRPSFFPLHREEELLLGIPRPKWKDLKPYKVHSRIFDATHTTEDGASTEEARVRLQPTETTDEVNVVPRIERDGRYTDEIVTLWFAPSLTSRQRAMVHQAARDLELGHISIGERTSRQVVVWESSGLSIRVFPPPSPPLPPPALPMAFPSKPSPHLSSLIHCPVSSSPSSSSRKHQNVAAVTAARTDRTTTSVKALKPSRGDKVSDQTESTVSHVDSSTLLHEKCEDCAVCDDVNMSSSIGGHGAENGWSALDTSKDKPSVTEQYKELREHPMAAASSALSVATIPGVRVGTKRLLDVGCTSPSHRATEENCTQGSPGQITVPTSETSVVVMTTGDSDVSIAGPVKEDDVEVVRVTNTPTAQASKLVWNNRRPRQLTQQSQSFSNSAGGVVCFVIVGAVDGIAEEITSAPEESNILETRRVVVEIKNRMSSVKDPPPLYDQIQLVTYMLMTDAPVGDLVQFVKNRAITRKQTKANVEPPDITISRVELDCKPYHHRRHWQANVLPRLYEFARMVYKFRSDDALRWRYLLASPEEQRELLVKCCPYLDSSISR